MPQEITETAKLQCNQGTVTTTLKVTSQQFAKINDKLQATEEDKQANVNIMPFGQCKLKPTTSGYLPCMPTPIKWENTSFSTIDGKKELNSASCIQCAIGGKITFTDTGGNDFVSSETE
ncbi:DUF4280 domain-containing protein [Capnocytophaga sp. oral taxon 336]|jgi:hypothetical protein|uniref:DUF4280 domain-containing protein n=1 Tax=Capnocytophaga sp. oral taxon 336 TaxID=712216 RepID=UPI00034EBEE3|nr:DUF4280 domain-containing protein [Capnocytophaga sp. oral taxon 336]EPD97745.1 hypothetical protein HMPREF1528_02413 [Capnocytophaga sp. oral taxon 336 str. F0502]